MTELIDSAQLSGIDFSASYSVFGGTFDPVHPGHINAVSLLLAHFPLVIVAPTSANPWKAEAPTPLADRVEMLRLALRAAELPLIGAPGEQLSGQVGVYVYSEGYSFSEELVAKFRNLVAGTLYWAVGKDIAHEVEKWRNWSAQTVATIVVPIAPQIHASEIRSGEQELLPSIREYAAKRGLYKHQQ